MNYRIALFFVTLCCLHSLTHAQSKPPCYPKQLGSTGSNFKQGATDTVRWVAWTCTSKTKVTLIVYSAPKAYELVHPNTDGLKPIKTAEAYLAANVKTGPDPGAVAAAREAFK